MPCTTLPTLTELQRDEQQRALSRLAQALGNGTVSAVIGPGGSIAFRGVAWNATEAPVSDLCAYRALTAANSPELRRAVMRAEALSGRKLNPHAIGAGVHSHDGGRTWGAH